MPDTATPVAPVLPSPAIYRGVLLPGGETQVWRAREAAPGHALAVLAPRTAAEGSHSPTGFGWGYAGSGAAELARAILVDALGEAGVCPACAGRGRVVYEPAANADDPPVPWDPDRHGDTHADGALSCLGCDGTGSAVTRPVYMSFKFAVIARLPEDQPFTITREAVLTWYRRHTATERP